MVWFKVDDTLPHHSKVLAVGNAAMGLWVRAGAWSMQQLTDGFVPCHVIPALGTQGEADALVAHGLWREVDGGYEFHEWDQRQPSREKVQSDRDAATERQRSARGRAQSQRESQRESQRDNSVTGGSPSRSPRPDPTRPDHKYSRSSTDVEADFETWWKHYPRKVAKGQARKAYKAARKKTDHPSLVAAIEQQAPHLTSKGAKYCPHASTWLNGERWNDEQSSSDCAPIPFTPPPPPDDIADDPAAYDRYMREQMQQRRTA